MTARGLSSFLFILYCVEAGTFLVMLPWSPFWDRMALSLPQVELQLAALQPWVRGAVTGFGLLHLVWGAHDLDAWLIARRQRTSAALTGPPDSPS